MKEKNNQGKSLQERIAEAESRRKNATISDIIAAKRREADSIEQSARGSFKVGESWDDLPFTEVDLERALDNAAQIRKEADRLEAALERECGDAAKLREAVKETQSVIAKCMDILNKIPDGCGYGGLIDDVADELCDLREQYVKPALAAPPRNCDRFNTGDPMKDSEDAYGAWERHCDNPTIPPSCKVESAFKHWLFAPATEKEGGNDGNE